MTECHSTNDYLLELSRQSDIPEGTVVMTEYQTQGRGQRGNQWMSEPGKNVLFSVLLRPTDLSGDQNFLLNKVVCLSMLDALQPLMTESSQLRIKWPNDIYLNKKKLAGILIENQLSGRWIDRSVLGIGLNVNQPSFSIENATSLLMELGYEADTHLILDRILGGIDFRYAQLLEGGREELDTEYLDKLLWIRENHWFRDKERKFEGRIDGVDHLGKLMVTRGDDQYSYNVQEIEFLY